MSAVTYGIGGYRPAHPSQGKIEEHDDVTSTVTRWDDAGAVIESRPYTAQETARAATGAMERTKTTNRSTLEQRATQALTANATYLALTTPTNAQNLAQIRLLTRETSAIIRLILNQIDTTDGT